MNFPNLNLDLLKGYARKWVKDFSNTQIGKITLYRYSQPSRHAQSRSEIRNQKAYTRYCIVFDVKNDSLPSNNGLLKLGLGRSGDIYQILECYKKNNRAYYDLIDNGFTDVYIKQPPDNFREDWFFHTGKSAKNDTGTIWWNEGVVLFDLADDCRTTDQNINVAGLQPVETDTAISNPPKQEAQSSNFLTRDGDIWHVGFGGRDARIKHLKGLLFISHLLDRPRENISCQELFQMTGSGNEPDNIMSEGRAIDEGLHIGSRGQTTSDSEARKQYLERFSTLSNDLDNVENSPEGEMMRKEIEKEIETIMPYLKERFFADPNDKKAQVNVKKRLETVYAAMQKADMKKLAEHLQNHIKPDGAFGLHYTGSLAWKITIKK